MRAVLIILTTEQRCRLIQPSGVKRAELFRQAVQLLINIRLQQLKHAAGRKFVRLFPVIHKPVNAFLQTSAGKFGRGGFKAIAAQLGKGVTENQIIKRKLAETPADSSLGAG